MQLNVIAVNTSFGLTMRCIVGKCDYSAYCDGPTVWATTPKGKPIPLEPWGDSDDLTDAHCTAQWAMLHGPRSCRNSAWHSQKKAVQ
jgi:hypothetical protein